MKTTANPLCRTIASLLRSHGVKTVVASPGSRNAPILLAISREKELDVKIVIDERSAAFMALGYSLISKTPVALVCTSGSALLNYAPAVAEAFYRKVPLIVVSADRPMSWIGQDDSQTIIQPGALAHFVKCSYDIPSVWTDENIWFANRVTNDALITAVSGRQGPVHINVQIAEPIDQTVECESVKGDMERRVVTLVRPSAKMDTRAIRDLGCRLASPKKVMIVVGFNPPDTVLNKALSRLSQLPNVVILTETVANLHNDNFIGRIDATLAAMKPEKTSDMVPDIVITTGGALISRHIKTFIRNHDIAEHWHVGEIEDTVDCFRKLTMRIEVNPSIFFQQLASAMQPHKHYSDYAIDWEVLKNRADSLTDSYLSKSLWSDFKMFGTLLPMIPPRWNCQFSNGTSIRYCQIFGQHRMHRCDCNRGVSGIDGSTSTAIGASLAYRSDVTLLISGDMSAIYDIGALTTDLLSPRFKMIVIDNGGGGIFRFIKSTSEMDIREQMLCAPPSRSVADIGRANGFAVYQASDEISFRSEFKKFSAQIDRPAMLVVATPSLLSAEVLKNYFEFCKTK